MGKLRNAKTKYTYKLFPNHNGYLGTVVSVSKKNILVKVHRAVAFMFVDNPYNKEQVNHIDGNKLNNQSDNLEWVTSQENLKHAVKLGLKNSGERCRWAKLTNNDVRQIRAFAINKTHTQKELAKMFNVSRQTINDVVCKRTYKDA